MKDTGLALTIEAKGEIISTNFPKFAVAVRKRISEINKDLKLTRISTTPMPTLKPSNRRRFAEGG